MENQQQHIYQLRECVSEDDFKLFDEVQIKVFVEGQNIDKDAVMDKTGELKFFNFYVDDHHVGSIRHNHKTKGYKIQRVAIKADHRRKGYGKKMLMAVLDDIRSVIKEGEVIFSEIQHQTKEFYLACGFDVDTDHPMTIQNILHYNAVLDPK